MAMLSLRSAILALTTGVVGVLLGVGGATLSRAAVASGAASDHVVFSGPLPNVPGKVLTAVEVEYAPGGHPRHIGMQAVCLPTWCPERFARRTL